MQITHDHKLIFYKKCTVIPRNASQISIVFVHRMQSFNLPYHCNTKRLTLKLNDAIFMETKPLKKKKLHLKIL